MKDKKIAELVNTLRDIAIKYAGTQQLRSHIAHALVAPLQAEEQKLVKAQQDIDYLADRVPEVHHNGMMQLSQQLAETRRQLEAAQRERDEAVLLRLEVSGALSSATDRYEKAEAEIKRRDAQEPAAANHPAIPDSCRPAEQD